MNRRKYGKPKVGKSAANLAMLYQSPTKHAEDNLVGESADQTKKPPAQKQQKLSR